MSNYTTSTNNTIAEIDLSALKNNMNIITSITKGAKLLNILKANAYGHGIIEMAKASEKFKADAIGVANVDEGIKIRKSGVKIPIVVLFQHFKSESAEVCKYNLSPVISNSEFLSYYDKYLERYKNNSKLKVFIKVDTGLNRMGAKPEEVLDLAKKVLSCKNLILEGISTHYAAADIDDLKGRDFTKKQIKTFNDVINNLKSNKIKLNTIHSANSSAILSYKKTIFDMVRAGIILYGYPPANADKLKIKPVMEVKSKIVLIKKLKKGESVSYGMTWKANKDTKIALIPIGYADGIPRKLSNNWEVKIKDKYYPVRGRICMDLTMIEIFNDKINVEDEVLIFGNDKKLNAETMAKKSGTISHEILTNIGDRVKRIYKN